MKALSIKQPWVWAILKAGKDVENRDWPTRFRGTVALHASKGMTGDEYDSAAHFMKYEVGTVEFKDIPNPLDLPRGGIVGFVDIVDCVTKSNSPWFVGDYGFVLRNPRILEAPIECKGALGFWDVPSEIECQMRIAA